MAEQKKNEVAVNNNSVTYNVAGQDVTLSRQIVRDYLVRGGGNVSDQDLVQFISICKYNQLNPFLSEAYLVKFGNNPAQMVVSKEALLKRADVCPGYDGMESGIIVLRDGQYVELDGCFYGENDKLVGGWAKVYRTDRTHPIIAKVRLDEYDKKQSTWNDKPSTMIAKVAKVQALREAFPAQLGAMYTDAEYVDYQDVTGQVAEEKKENGNRTRIAMPAADPEPGRDGGNAQAQPANGGNNGNGEQPNTPGF